jgi:hypothetical protein
VPVSAPAGRAGAVGLRPERRRAVLLTRFAAAAGAVAFILLATANGAGYRYGVQDQAFYIPVVVRSLDPALFPRDFSLIDAQGRLMVVDEVLAGLARTTGVSLKLLIMGLLCVRDLHIALTLL